MTDKRLFELTQEEYNALINAYANVLNEMRVRWQVNHDMYQIETSDEDRQLNRAWLTLGAKPFSQHIFDSALPALQGKLGLYPDSVDAKALALALIKLNGQAR